jgi:hypothetical protein
MESLTEAESILVKASRDSTSTTARGFRAGSTWTVVGCAGTALILAANAREVVLGQIDWVTFWNTIGFLIVLAAFWGMQWQSTRFAALSQSAIAKLGRDRRCPGCGQLVAFGDEHVP